MPNRGSYLPAFTTRQSDNAYKFNKIDIEATIRSKISPVGSKPLSKKPLNYDLVVQDVLQASYNTTSSGDFTRNVNAGEKLQHKNLRM